jgi:predicted nuclease of predicted toxin-antitoxin system
LRLLLDEQLSPEIARQLRARGNDVHAAVERDDLVSLADRDLFERMAAEHRAIVTNDVVDFVQLFNEALAAGRGHYGLLLTDDRSMPRSRQTIGLFVDVLGAFLASHPADDALRNQLRWLTPSGAARRDRRTAW